MSIPPKKNLPKWAHNTSQLPTVGVILGSGLVSSINNATGVITLADGTLINIVQSPTGTFTFNVVTPIPVADLSTGTNGYVLTMVAGVPVWQAAGGGGAAVFDTTAQALVQHYYVMNETTGTNITDSGTTGGATGTYAGTGVLLNQVALRNDGEGCPIFDGATGYATIPDNTTTTGFTFATMCEFNPKWDPAASLYSLWDTNANVGGSDTGFILYTSGGALTIQFGGAGTYASITVGNFLSGAQVPLGPIFFAFTHTGTVGTLYVNGFPVGSATLAYVKGGNPITIGALVGGASYNVPASFGKAIVHNAALTQAQISSLNNAQPIR